MGMLSTTIRRTFAGAIESPVISSAWQIPMSPAAFAQPALPLLIARRMSQSLTASMQTSHESQVPPCGGASSLIQVSNGFLPATSIASISDFNVFRISESRVTVWPGGKKSLHRLEIMTRSLDDLAMNSSLPLRFQLAALLTRFEYDNSGNQKLPPGKTQLGGV